MASSKILFSEEIQLPPKMFWFVMTLVLGGALAVAGVFGYGLYQQLVLKQPWGTTPVSDGTLVALSITVVLGMLVLEVPLVFLLLNARQRVRLTASKLSIDAPLVGRSLAVSDIETWELKPSRSYGLQYRMGGGWHINFGGKHCIHFRTRNGRFALGTSQPEAFEAALRQARGPETGA